MRTEFRPDEKAVLAPPHPGDFGIPREHWGKAQNFADYWWRKNQVAATPQQQAEPVAWEHHAKKLTHWLHCMSYNDSYFGEPAGLVKQVTTELNRLIGTALRSALEQPAEPAEGNTLLKAFLAAAKEAGVTHLQQAEPLAQPISFAGLTLTEVRVPFGMTVRFEGGALIVECAASTAQPPAPPTTQP